MISKDGRVGLMVFARRSLALAVAVMCGSAGVGASLDTQPFEFLMLRDGTPIGNHKVIVRQVGEETHVDVAIDIDVSFAFLTLFRYQHRNQEVWRDGRLVSLESWTDDDGSKYSVSARAVENGLMVDGSSGRFLAPADIVPTSYWHPSTVEQDRLLDTQKGQILAVAVTPQGSDMVEVDGMRLPAERYSLSGDLTLTLWYEPGGRWVKSAFEARGAEVEYSLLNAPESFAPASASDGAPAR